MVDGKVLARRAVVLLGMLLFTGIVVNHGRSALVRADDLVAPGVGRCGELQIVGPEGRVTSACPLKHTSVVADIPGTCARVKVTQEFFNPTADKIEAVYVFPLPDDAAVDWMEMKVGERTIKGEIKEREEARRIYEQARQEGHVTALLDQERPNIFTQSVANIMPGETVLVTISYLQILNYEDGEYEFVFPMVVGPRYMPGAPTGNTGGGIFPDTDKVPDGSKISPPITPRGIRAGHDISIEVRIDAGIPITGIRSRQHQIVVERSGESGAVVTLKQLKVLPNKDFILNYRADGGGIQTGVLCHTRAEGDGFFTLIVQPPAKPQASSIIPKEMIFVIDSSGSMMGEPIEKAKETMALCIEQMNPYDTFQLISFSNDVTRLFDKPQPNTPDNRLMGLTFLRDRMGSGGTEMMKPIMEALTPPPDGSRLRIVCFMTDGYVGNDMEIMDAIKKNLGESRVFAFGVGSSVNRYLLDGMAKIGKGAVEYVTLGEPGSEPANRFADRIGNPLLTDVKVDWGNLAVTQIYPESAPDLFSAKPLIFKGRYSKPGSGKVTISGMCGDEPWSQTVDVVLSANEPGHAALPALWAREYIAMLMEQDLAGIQEGKPNPEIKDSIIRTALDFRLMSQYTSFVAVEEKIFTQGGTPVKVMVPVEMPEGVQYEGIFGLEDRKDGGFGGMARRGVAYKMAAPSAASGRPAAGVVMNGPVSAASPPQSFYSWGLAMDVASGGSYRLDPELEKLIEAWKKDGKAPKDSKVKIESGKAQVMIWVAAVTPENIKKLKDLGCEIKTSSSASSGILAWAPVEKLKEISELGFVQQVRVPVYGK
ncbi:MAG: VWA domain-containing protein [Armatimonadetes bacterium]|nr:VWA domain-containing protein [Armatimonadota bacterium]